MSENSRPPLVALGEPLDSKAPRTGWEAHRFGVTAVTPGTGTVCGAGDRHRVRVWTGTSPREPPAGDDRAEVTVMLQAPCDTPSSCSATPRTRSRCRRPSSRRSWTSTPRCATKLTRSGELVNGAGLAHPEQTLVLQRGRDGLSARRGPTGSRRGAHDRVLHRRLRDRGSSARHRGAHPRPSRDGGGAPHGARLGGLRTSRAQTAPGATRPVS